MDKVLEMRNKRAKLIADMRGLLDAAEAEKRSMSAEERESYGKMEKDVDALTTEIKMQERQAALEAEIRDIPPAPRPGNPGATPEERKLMAFRNFLTTGNPAEYRALANDSDAAGGYLHAAEQFVARLIAGLNNQVWVRGLATVLPVTSSDSLGCPSLTDPADPTWTTEVASVSEDSTMAFGRRELKPHQLSKLIKVSMKLLKTSALPVENLIADRFAYIFGATQENAFLNGTGSGEPLGVFTANANGVTTARDVSTGNEATAITADGLINCKFSLKSQYRSKARWIFHRDGVKMISKLKDSEGQYLWRPGLLSNEPDMLLGIPLLESEYAPNTFTTGLYVGILGDFSYYWIAELQNLEIQRLNELYAGTSQVGFIGRGYWDGAPVLAEAFARVKLV
jgi:HK97 family phage major capsid protein